MASRLVVCALALAAQALAAVKSTGRTVDVNGSAYFVPPRSVARLARAATAGWDDGLVALTVVNVDTPSLSSATVADASAEFGAVDDVWCSGFLDAIYVQLDRAGGAQPYHWSITAEHPVLVAAANATRLPPGPYFLETATGAVFKAYRLYSDFSGAFTESVYQDDDNGFSVLPAGLPGQSIGIAVPSRLYYTRTPEKPLAGVRVGIKDIFDIKGLRTGNGNRAWYQFYPPASANAGVVQSLVDAGAVVVGKLITSQFANGEAATADWVDYHEPFNPRGDGYQDTQTSSAGSGAAAGAYGWLDVTLGSDTGGSVRGPAQRQGVFGNRPTWNLTSLAGAMPLAPPLDTPGLLARDPALLKAAGEAMYPRMRAYAAYPSKIVTLGFPSNASTKVDGLVLAFLTKVQTFLNASVSALDVFDEFARKTPAASSTKDLGAFFNETYATIIAKEQTRLLRDPWFAEYAAKHDGRRPAVDPVPTARWGYGDSQPESVLEQALSNKTIFQSWFESSYLTPHLDTPTCADKIMLYVGYEGVPQPRNLYLEAPKPPFGFDLSQISIFAGCPDFAVPMGEVSTYSNITRHDEVLPVAVDFVAPRGCDGMLFSLISDLAKAGIVGVSEAGQSFVSGGETLVRRAGEVAV